MCAVADQRSPMRHKAGHASGGHDALTGNLDANARVAVDIVGGGSGTRRTIRFAAGTGLGITVADDAQAEVVTVTPTLDEGILRYASLELTAAQVKALRATPITCVAAPAAGKMIEFISAVLALDYGTVVYTLGVPPADLQFRYHDGAGVPVSLVATSTGFLDQAADGAKIVTAQGTPYFTRAQCEAKAIVLHNVGLAELLNGDSPLAVRVAYRVHLTGW